MNINIVHPGADALASIQTAIDAGQEIRRSPHVGNVNAEELQLALGIAGMGGSIELKLVDTIQGNDSYSHPNHLIVGGEYIPLASNNASRGRVVGACALQDLAKQRVQDLGLELPVTNSLRDLHLNALRLATPDSIGIDLSSEFFGNIGQDVYALVIEKASQAIKRPLRTVGNDGKIATLTGDQASAGIFGVGNNRMTGILPPLESMIAIEILKAAMDTQGSDSQIVHIAGPDMIRYTRDPEIMQPVTTIVDKVSAEIGGFQNTTVEYVVPSMAELLATGELPTLHDIESQYDILVKSL